MKMTLKLAVLSILASFLVFGSAAQAEYPEKPVTFIVPWPPGDLEDITTRMIAEEFQKEYGVAAAVVNKPGGGGGPFPGAVEVAKAPADGSVIGSFVIGVPTVGPLMLEALMTQDMYLAGSMLMVLSLLGVFGTLVSDLLLLCLDPRIRYGGGGDE